MNYVPFGVALRGIPNIMVDCSHTTDTVLELSHWPQNLTPSEYKADTSAEIALKFVCSTNYSEYAGRVQAVSNDHYDVDGLLSIWPLLFPQEGLAMAELIVQTATTGDFDCYTTTQAVKSCLALNSLEQFSLQPTITRSGWSTDEITGFLYKTLLSLTFDCLTRPEIFQHLWTEEYRTVENSMEAIATKQAHLTEYPELDLAIIESDWPLHDFAVNAATQCLRILTIFQENIYCFRYRYESFVDLVSRPVFPRIHLDGFVKALNQWEQAPGSWFCESVASAHPRLQLYSRIGAPSPSKISRDRFVQALHDYLLTGEKQTDLQWRSTDGWLNEAGVPVPPSLVPRGE